MVSRSSGFCENCGAPLEPGMRFCEGCGQPIAAAAPPTPAAPAGGGSGKTGLIAVIVGLVVVIWAGAGYYFWQAAPGKVGVPPPPAAKSVTPPQPTPSSPPPAFDPKAPAVPYFPPPASAPPPVAPPVAAPTAPSPPPSPVYPGTIASGPSWPWTSERLITDRDLQLLGARDLELMRNEIYARHGWVFKRDDLRQFFQSQPWYRPKGTLANREEANRLAAAAMNQIERRNVQIIQQYERGGR